VQALVGIGILGFPPSRVDHRFRDADTIRVVQGQGLGYPGQAADTERTAEAEFRQGVVH
jgi:hypothetical protein